MGNKVFTGQTEVGPFLGAEFWKKGTKLEGTVIDKFQTANGPSYTFRLRKSIAVNGENTMIVNVGGLKGWINAIKITGCGDLQPGDAVVAECIGFSDTGKENEMIKFKMSVSRPDDF